MMLLETAWSKQINSFCKLFSEGIGLPIYAIDYFTGAPLSFIDFNCEIWKDHSLLFNYIQTNHQAGYL